LTAPQTDKYFNLINPLIIKLTTIMKSITLLICLLFITTIGRSQEFNLLNTSPGERAQTQEDKWEPIESQYKVDWRERSIGLIFMPIPLVKSIEITGSKGTKKIGDVDKIFSVGFGAALNYDFNASGSGLGNITYFAVLLGGGESDLQAYDFFTALKYDITFGPISKFELSPLFGLGNLAFVNTKESLNVGSSLYVSGGARITYLATNNLFVGADIQTTPIIFDPEKLIGVKNTEHPFVGEVESAKINYSFFAQINLSIRYNIF
jgi:hypothetical protein